MKETDTMIIFLKNWLSNFYHSPFTEDEIYFSNVEQYFMYHKAKFFGDIESVSRILSTNKASEARELGQLIKPFNDSWHDVRYSVMFKGNLLKYQQNKALRELLLATGNKILVEASPSDPTWGVALSEDDPRVISPSTWQGKNLLGLCLMEVRTVLSSD